MRSFDLNCALAVLRKLFPEKSIARIHKLDKGLSNINFYFEVDNNACLLKAFDNEIPMTALAAQNCFAQQGLTQKVIYIDERERVAVFEYLTSVEGPVIFQSDLIELLTEVHRYSCTEMDPLDLQAEVKRASARLSLSQVGNYLIEQLCFFPTEIRYCHNDLVKENVLNTVAGLRFIDFEYAQANDLYFDLAALSCSFDLSSSQLSEVLARYFAFNSASVPSYAENKLDVYIGVYLLLCIAWYKEREMTDESIMVEKQFITWCDRHNLDCAP
ncbi:phosphotransferase [Pseudoalteromonas luteoviolacea]|uniref:phosphotransferase n=1 Tax=Pseudoalteromonas luteoviolacea TaxID=43657 RepID=UPI001F2701A0|nr:phosphotransferase [Pseudoalteromonas luteoviolacea]MCF6441430.1 phosphotransferase [Pseudoalteromonas luteoviolacea]